MEKWQKAYACHIPYLRKHASYDCQFWYTFVKWWYLQMAQNDKNSVCLTQYIRNCTSYDCGFWYRCVKWWYLQQVFSFFSKFWFFGFLEGGVKGQKMTHNYQFQSVTLFISRTVTTVICSYPGQGTWQDLNPPLMIPF